MKVKDIYRAIDCFAPFDTQADFDHSGLQVGDFEAEVSGVLVAVDLDFDVIEEAKALGCNLIVTHHPAIWSPLSAVVAADYTSRLVMRLVQADIHYIAAHTNVDKCSGGNSERLAQALGATIEGRLAIDEFAVRFCMQPITLGKLLEKVRSTLHDPLAFAVGENDTLSIGALCTGAGADDDTIAYCCQNGLVYLTGEVKHHQLRYVEQNKGHLICFGHFTSEQIFVRIIIEVLQKAGVVAHASAQKNPCFVG